MRKLCEGQIESVTAASRKEVHSILRFLGYGAAFHPVFGNTSAYFVKNRDLYLIDCGETVFHKLYERDMLTEYENIYVIITHRHADHVGSLGSLISYIYFVLGKKVTVIHPDTELQDFLDLTGIDRAAYTMNICMKTVIGGVMIEAIPVKHAEDMNCYGYLISDSGRTIYYSGDSYEIPKRILDTFLDGKIAELFQDTASKVSAHRSHLPLPELAGLIPPELRKQVFCMHFNCDFSDEIDEMGFNNVIKYAD